MNKEINQTKQCNQCKKEFAKQELYLIGIKQKEFFCRECAQNVKSECMWCGKELEEKQWAIFGGGNPSQKLTEIINHDNCHGDKHYRYYLTCEEKKEHGIRPNQSCPSRINDWWVEKKKQNRQEKLNKGWKECQGKAIYWKADPQTGKKEFSMDCWKLVPPGEKYCKDDNCVYFTAVCNNIHSEERKRIADKWNQRNQEKYRKANEWWNSLSLAEKQAELKAEETELKSLGLQRQRCWIENVDKNSILFENDKLYYDNMDKIPPSFLDRFGMSFQWESVWKNDGNHSSPFQAQAKDEKEKEISNKRVLLEQAKENANNELVAKLEKQVLELEDRQLENNLSAENSTPNKAIIYWIAGLSVLSLIGLFYCWKKKNGKRK